MNTRGTWFVFPDIHFPNHDQRALDIALEAHAYVRPDFTLFLGDGLDCDVFSTHPRKSLSEQNESDYLIHEVAPMRRLLDTVQASTKKRTTYLGGNHEWRVERFAISVGRAGESIFDLISPRVLLAKTAKHEPRKAFDYIPYTPGSGFLPDNYVEIAPETSGGGLVAVHGWSHSKHAAAKHLDLARPRSIMFGHVHREQTHTSRNPWTGQAHKGFSCGTLSQLFQAYHHGTPNDWTHGFAIIYVGRTSWTEYVITIGPHGCVMPDGKQIGDRAGRKLRRAA